MYGCCRCLPLASLPADAAQRTHRKHPRGEEFSRVANSWRVFLVHWWLLQDLSARGHIARCDFISAVMENKSVALWVCGAVRCGGARDPCVLCFVFSSYGYMTPTHPLTKMLGRESGQTLETTRLLQVAAWSENAVVRYFVLYIPSAVPYLFLFLPNGWINTEVFFLPFCPDEDVRE